MKSQHLLLMDKTLMKSNNTKSLQTNKVLHKKRCTNFNICSTRNVLKVFIIYLNHRNEKMTTSHEEN